MNNGKKILLHCCCGPCATSSIEKLIGDGFKIVLFFSNSNIFPESEFDKRYENLLRVASFYNLEVVKDVYEHDKWLEAVKGYEGEKEHGVRCPLCFDFSLNRACQYLKNYDFDYFCTTLTVSRFKNSKLIFQVGEKYYPFIQIDFKKKNGFARSLEISKELGLYRQQYCGCEFSLRDRNKEK